MIAFHPVWRFLNVLILHRSPNVILNVVADLGLLLLVPGRLPHLIGLPPGPELSLVPLLPLVPLPLRLLFQSTLNSYLLLLLHSIPTVLTVPLSLCLLFRR